MPEKNAYLRRQQLLLFTDARRRIEDAGIAEYASGHFCRVSPFAAMYFQLRADTIGFGSGAVSLSDQRFLSHEKGRLHAYVDDPLSFDVATPAGNDRVLVSFLQAGLAMFDGILRSEWRISTGTDLDEVLDRLTIAPLARLLRKRGLTEDAHGRGSRPRRPYSSWRRCVWPGSRSPRWSGPGYAWSTPSRCPLPRGRRAGCGRGRGGARR